MNENDTLEDLYPSVNVLTNTMTDINLPASTSNENPNTVMNIDAETEVFDRIANKLLRSGLLLTALELHAELIERGKELPRLREFFDNPHNFEKHLENSTHNKPDIYLFAKNQPKSPSEQTFDSLDFTHYSDDDIEHHGDERIAVLEFELRKARQTIDSLRASLTMSTTGQSYQDSVDIEEIMHSKSQNQSSFKTKSQNNETTIESFLTRDHLSRGSADGDSCPGDEDKCSKSTIIDPLDVFDPIGAISHDNHKYSLATLIKPHEKRAINYLINEYLMENNYKLTSITFCDENTEQDFDKWDDVGLNVIRPPDLLKLYRYYWQNCTSLLRTNSNATTIVSGGTRLPNTGSVVSADNDH